MPEHYGEAGMMGGAQPPPEGGQPPPGPPPEGGAPPPGGGQAAAPGHQQDASERDQAAFDFYMDKIGARLYTDQGVQSALKFIANQRDVATGIGKAAAMATVRADQQDKGQMPEEIVMGVADDTLERIAEIAVEAKMFDGDDQTVERAKRVLVAELAGHYDTQQDEVEEFMRSMGIDPQQAAQSAQAQGGQQPQGQPQGGQPPPPGAPPPTGGEQGGGLMGM